MKTRVVLICKGTYTRSFNVQRKRFFWWFTVAKFRFAEADSLFNKLQEEKAKYYADLLALKGGVIFESKSHK